MSERDNFSPTIRRAVAARAGWRCTLAGCGKLTVGPSEEAPDAATIIGDAAHISSAAAGGRRFDPTMTHEQRAGIDNAMWLCADHARLVDRDDVTYTVDVLRAMKREHETACALAVRSGSDLSLKTDLMAVGPAVVCAGSLVQIEASAWTLQLDHFLIGDVHALVSYIGTFDSQLTEAKYVLNNEFGDGRVLVGPPRLERRASGHVLMCPVAPSFPRTEVQKIGSSFATQPETNDLFLNPKGNIARVSGLDSLPQRVRETLSMQRGESPFYPTFGARLFEYFEAFRGSPWLDLLFKLDVVRQASIPFPDSLTRGSHTPLRCVTRVRDVELVDTTPMNNRLRVRFDFEVEGLGRWQQELAIYMPTAEQMANRAEQMAANPWLASIINP